MRGGFAYGVGASLLQNPRIDVREPGTYSPRSSPAPISSPRLNWRGSQGRHLSAARGLVGGPPADSSDSPHLGLVELPRATGALAAGLWDRAHQAFLLQVREDSLRVCSRPAKPLQELGSWTVAGRPSPISSVIAIASLRPSKPARSIRCPTRARRSPGSLSSSPSTSRINMRGWNPAIGPSRSSRLCSAGSSPRFRNSRDRIQRWRRKAHRGRSPSGDGWQVPASRKEDGQGGSGFQLGRRTTDGLRRVRRRLP